MGESKGSKGQPTKLTAETSELILDCMRAGNYLETAAGLAGCTASCIREWLRRGRREGSGIYFDFFAAYKKATALAEAQALETIRFAPEWQATAWRLERRYPDRWGRRERPQPAPKADKEQRTSTEIGNELIRKVEGTFENEPSNLRADDDDDDLS